MDYESRFEVPRLRDKEMETRAYAMLYAFVDFRLKHPLRRKRRSQKK